MKIDFKIIENRIVKSVLLKDDYIAPIIAFDNDENVNHYYIEIKNGKTEIAEFSFRVDTKELSCYQLVGCTQFSIIDKSMTIPEFCESSIFINSSDDKDNYGVTDFYSEKFTTEIYKNGLCTLFSDRRIENSVKSGNIILSFDSENNLVRVYVVDLRDSDLIHIKEVFSNG